MPLRELRQMKEAATGIARERLPSPCAVIGVPACTAKIIYQLLLFSAPIILFQIS